MRVNTQDITKQKHAKEIDKPAQRWFLFDAAIVIILGSLLYYGASWQIFGTATDAARYECYALAFWNGTQALDVLPREQCRFMTEVTPETLTNARVVSKMQQLGLPEGLINFVRSQPPDQRFHALPHEYPFLTLIPFSLGLVAPPVFSQVAFAIWMALLAGLLYLAIVHFRSRRAGVACALYLITAAWASAAGRFDLIPAGLTLLALFCATRERWNWAFALLALAVLFKFYPALLLLPFLIAQQKEVSEPWLSWRRWAPLGVFTGVCAVITAGSLLLSVDGTLAPFTYFGNRPVQVESLSSSLIWLASLVRPQKLQFVFTYGSLNVLSSRASLISIGMTLLLVGGLLYTFWLQWRGKITLAIAMLLALLVLILTGKVFSPQYMIWVVPLVAYIGEAKWRWLVTWIAIGLLTTWIYPTIYLMSPLMQVPEDPIFYPAVTARNFLLLGFTAVLFYLSTRRKVETVAEPELARHTELSDPQASSRDPE